MPHHDDRRSQHNDWRDQDRHQMGQYADDQRQYGGQRYLGHEQPDHDARNWGSRREQEDFGRRDPAQASYGRAGAPDLHNRPSGGYQRDWRADSGYNEPGYTQNHGYQGYGSRDERQGDFERSGYRNQSYQRDSWRGQGDSWRGQGGYEGGRGTEDRGDYGRFQGGSGGYRSNAGPYAGSQTYGGYGDQLGYGSYQGRSQQHHDPDYQQWREQQLRNLDDDYQSWRGERYKKFSDEFDSWRKNRQQGQPGQPQGQQSQADASASNAKPGSSGSGSK